MKDMDKKLDEIYQGFARGKEGDANANNSGLIAMAFAIAHLGDKLEKVASEYRKALEVSTGARAQKESRKEQVG